MSREEKERRCYEKNENKKIRRVGVKREWKDEMEKLRGKLKWRTGVESIVFCFFITSDRF